MLPDQDDVISDQAGKLAASAQAIGPSMAWEPSVLSQANARLNSG